MALNVAAFSQAYRNSEAALTCVETSLAGASRSLSGQVLPGSEDRNSGCAYAAPLEEHEHATGEAAIPASARICRRRTYC
jgi:hypothetical protein